MRVAISGDLEPNKDGSLDGVAAAMSWFDRTVPRGSVFATYRIATEMPDLLAELRESHEVGVHVHPREFGHDHDELARLSADRQAELISSTRAALADAVGCPHGEIRSFRAGRHSASETTIDVLRDLGFVADASVNVRYDDHLPERVLQRPTPFRWDGILEVPTTHARLPVVSRCALRALGGATVTATAHTLRSDTPLCSGERAMEYLLRTREAVSMYLHPYDATDYHGDLENGGAPFRRRFERLVSRLEDRGTSFVPVGAFGES